MSTHPNNYSLANKYKLLIYLTIKNDARSVNLVRRFADSINVLYVTADPDNICEIYHPNIEIYDFKTILGGLSRINVNLNIIKLTQKIESICKSENISHKKLVFIANNSRYTSLFGHFSRATLHFDFSLDVESNIKEKLMEKRLYLLTNSITTTTIKQKKLFENYFKSTFRVPDGIEHNLKPSNKRYEKNDILTIGCFTSRPELLNYQLIDKMASMYPSYSFCFASDKSFPEIEILKNVSFQMSTAVKPNYDLILLPIEKKYYEYLTRAFYENLCYLAPIIALKTLDLDTHRQLVQTYLSENELIESLQTLPRFNGNCALQKGILLQNCSWQSRMKQIESVILT